MGSAYRLVEGAKRLREAHCARSAPLEKFWDFRKARMKSVIKDGPPSFRRFAPLGPA